MSNQPLLTKSNFRGAIVLLIIIIGIFILPDVYRAFSEPDRLKVTALDAPERNAFIKVKKYSNKRYNYRQKESRFLPPPEKFNPNTYTVQEWMALGLSEKQANVILKFTKRKLRSNDDLKKIFVISDELFEIIKDSTYYDNQLPKNMNDGKEAVKEKELKKVDINTASEEELQSVPGIGPFFAKYIVKKRNELGGFVRKDQLLEVWKVDGEKYLAWEPYLILSKTGIKYLDLNKATAEEFAAHPYISWNLANSLVKLRTQKGRYTKIDEVKQSVLMTHELFEQLKPYFKIEE